MTLKAGHLGTDLVIDNLKDGSNFVSTEHKMGRVSVSLTVLSRNMHCAPTGDLRSRLSYTRVPLVDPDTGYPLRERIIRRILFERVRKEPIGLIVTATRIMQYIPYYPANLRTVKRLAQPATTIDYACWQGALYIASGKNFLVEWTGSTDPVDISEGWPAGYRYPKCVCVHEGLLMVGGFDAEASINAASEFIPTEIDDPATLMPYQYEVRSQDQDAITAMAPAPWGLMVYKRNHSYRVLGSDFAEGSDLDIQTHTPGIGCAGPRAWCTVLGVVHAYGNRGVYAYPNPVDKALPVTERVSSLFHANQTLDDIPVPTVEPDDETAELCFDPIENRLYVALVGEHDPSMVSGGNQ